MEKRVFVYMVLFLGCIACTGHFKDLNTDKTGITDEDTRIDWNHIGIPLGVVQQGIYFNYDFGKGKNWTYQIMQNLSADMFSGYMHDYKPLNGGSHNSDYNLQDGWNGTFWGYTYAYIMPQIKRLEDSTRTENPLFYAITKILKVEVMHRVSDYYGPIIYSNFGGMKSVYMPDTQQDVYHAFFDDLKEAVKTLSDYMDKPDEVFDFSRFDILMDGEILSWIKFANSLRMRLAVRIAMAEPEKARTEFQSAISDEHGYFEDPFELVKVSTRDGYTNPLGEINRVWGEVYMNASMESILNGFDDPRRKVFFEPCMEDVCLPDKNGKDSVIIPLKGQYRGIRQGTMFAHPYYAALSKIYVNVNTDAILMTAAEVWFLRAEAALRGWTSEEAGDCYERGVKCSFSQWQVPDADAYLQGDNRASDFKDVFTPENDIKARCKVSPCWDESASPEIKLERIITQKWLAIFPEGCEAWAEQRRTGYPRLFPVKYNNSRNGCIDTEIMIRRLNFPSTLLDESAEQYKALVDALGGKDNAGTRLWWDTGRNF
ncbi:MULTISPECIES: SusD/RagB family nutrient-binding outer membrane lipoprotein [Butyricimonas]|uniref:SusD/RagB family nutrient-binding outer membrane lipoprotein n=1 Tax=Butyricimonas TaxID=574697 RepID=UPI000C088CB8|nr:MULTISPECIES: SusD/RagB family nutrient-binding outer membrane lipoprotein [Butyricimonas]MCB6971786.1 SusD/RagB family nutrient-binding outer membrane lipoprotein [Butyricimonas synergistica]MCG4518606.1 SusD/RagB family nutrient-binding outer membrane lipoprotein [Butyricimonas sp. DFI.6.44]